MQALDKNSIDRQFICCDSHLFGYQFKQFTTTTTITTHTTGLFSIHISKSKTYIHYK
jgi:hypothetical protein